MKKLNLKILFVITIVIIMLSCTGGRAPSGINTNIYYAEGSCLQNSVINENAYKPYTGNVYIVFKNIAEQYNDSTFDSLKKNSIITKAVKGAISILVEPGTYYIIPDTMFCLSCDNLVEIKKDDLIERKFKFYKCINK